MQRKKTPSTFPPESTNTTASPQINTKKKKKKTSTQITTSRPPPHPIQQQSLCTSGANSSERRHDAAGDEGRNRGEVKANACVQFLGEVLAGMSFRTGFLSLSARIFKPITRWLCSSHTPAPLDPWATNSEYRIILGATPGGEGRTMPSAVTTTFSAVLVEAREIILGRMRANVNRGVLNTGRCRCRNENGEGMFATVNNEYN